VLKQGLIDRPRSCQRLCGQFKINRVPERNGSDNEIQPAGSIALVFKRTVSDFSQAVEEERNSWSSIAIVAISVFLGLLGAQTNDQPDTRPSASPAKTHHHKVHHKKSTAPLPSPSPSATPKWQNH
jgi:hypothetical protein